VAAKHLLSEDDLRADEPTRRPFEGTYEHRGLPASAGFFLGYHRFGRFPGALNDRDAVDKFIIHVGTPAAARAPGCSVGHAALHFAILAAAQLCPTIGQEGLVYAAQQCHSRAAAVYACECTKVPSFTL
jgi:hypothetical protein